MVAPPGDGALAVHRRGGSASLCAMAEPKIAQRAPYVLECPPGTYAWCACGRSKKQPFCDGSHAGSGFVPAIESLTETRRVAWCGCKHTKNKPFCDGSHGGLPR
jgi:CDGSH-type Zn-finger protein